MPRGKFDQLPTAGLGFLAQHLDQQAWSATADALAPLVLPGSVAERLNLDGRAVGQYLVGQPPQGILTSGLLGAMAPPGAFSRPGYGPRIDHTWVRVDGG